MDDIMFVALGPFYVAAVAVSFWGVYILAHKAQKMDASATETQMTETTSPASTQQK